MHSLVYQPKDKDQHLHFWLMGMVWHGACHTIRHTKGASLPAPQDSRHAGSCFTSWHLHMRGPSAGAFGHVYWPAASEVSACRWPACEKVPETCRPSSARTQLTCELQQASEKMLPAQRHRGSSSNCRQRQLSCR